MARSRRPRPVGILDVASRANVSPATVSRYFNHPEVVRLKTRERIEAAIVELGYVRNRAASSLNRGRTGAVGMIVPTVDNAIFAELIDAFGAALNTFGRALLLSAHGYDLAAEMFLAQALIEHQVDGVVLVGAEHDAATLDLLARHDVPALTVWNWRRGARVPCIGTDNRELGRLAAGHLVSLGHRDVACLFPESRGNDRAADRARGAWDAFAKAGAPVPKHRRLVCPYDTMVAKELIVSVLRSPDPPTAILAGNDIIAQAAIHAAHAAGVTVPGSVSIIGIGDFRGSAAFEPGLTTIRIPARRIGAEAAAAMDTLISIGGEASDVSIRVSPSLVERGSTGRIAR